MSGVAVKSRVRYFDMMKGVAIFMVVMGHVITFCVREIDRAAIFKFIGAIHMPLFFFVSGWFSFKLVDGTRLAMPRLGKRAFQLLVPMAVVSTLWVWYFPHSGLESPLPRTLPGLWADPWKGGYWFTLSLFEVILVYAAIVPALSRLSTPVGNVMVSLVAWAVLFGLFIKLPRNVVGWLSLSQTVMYFPAFMIGMIGHRFRAGFMWLVDKSWCQTIAVVVFSVALYIYCWPWEFGIGVCDNIVLGAVLHIALIPVAVAVFGRWSERAYAPDSSPVAGFFPGIWGYLGKQSLAIYLLHYFFLFPMGDVFRTWLLGMNVSFVPLLFFSALWSAAIIACVLGVVKVLEPSKQLSFLLTGKI